MVDAVRRASFSYIIGTDDIQARITVYTNRVFIVVSQTGSLGNVLVVRIEAAEGGQASVFDVRTVLGNRESPAHLACARELARELQKKGCIRPLVVCLALNKLDLAAVKATVNAVGSSEIWSPRQLHPDGI